MDKIDEGVRMLLQIIYDTQIYREYRRQEEELRLDAQLYQRVMSFRERNFRLQNNAVDGAIIQVADSIYHESRELRKIPQVNAYLDAELALCKMMQRIARTMVNGLEIDIPDIG